MKNGTVVAISIIFSGALIAGAVMLNNNNSISGSTSVSASNSGHGGGGNVSSYRPVSQNDHIRGDINAPITIIEYSDFECPFCARLHPTLTRVVNDFPEVRWVYRHYPLSSIHSRAQRASIASECVAKLAGNDAFWQFSDALFNNQRGLGDSLYFSLAEGYGISENALESCMSDKSIASKVNSDLDDAIATGGRGTPHSLIITPNGDAVAVPGALPYEQFAQFINSISAN